AFTARGSAASVPSRPPHLPSRGAIFKWATILASVAPPHSSNATYPTSRVKHPTPSPHPHRILALPSFRRFSPYVSRRTSTRTSLRPPEARTGRPDGGLRTSADTPGPSPNG